LDELRVPGKVFDSIFIPRQHDIDLVLPRPSGASPRVHVEIARPGGAPADGAKSARDRIAALREQIARLQDAIAALEREVPAPGNDAP
ncbi:MAG: hypothetical protein KDA25_07985, partial [Phycisphaerales bacterium]|nr:hypothetical protein [Phycisphaerales bacterium]